MKYLLNLIVCILILHLSYSIEKKGYDKDFITPQPIIGIMMQPSKNLDYPSDVYSQAVASYIKFVEQGGGRVIPIHQDGPQEYYDYMFERINGLLFMGGSSKFTRYTQLGFNGYYMFQKAIEANDNGDYFPIWGTCLGFEMLAMYASDFELELGWIEDQDDKSRTVQVQNEDLAIFNQMPQHIYEAIQTEPLSFYHHMRDVTYQMFKDQPKLPDFFHIAATSQNDLGDVFISIIEAKNYPFYGTQFHPEKNSYEFKIPANRSTDGIEMGQYYANFFVRQAKFSSHQFENEQMLREMIIYNFSPVFNIEDNPFEQTYYFKNYWITFENCDINTCPWEYQWQQLD